MIRTAFTLLGLFAAGFAAGWLINAKREGLARRELGELQAEVSSTRRHVQAAIDSLD